MKTIGPLIKDLTSFFNAVSSIVLYLAGNDLG